MQALLPYHCMYLPVWIGGNVYCNGATVSKHEKNGLVPDQKVEVDLVEENGKMILKTNIGEFLKGFKTELLDSDKLGKAFEPEQRFEDPDGNTIIFDTDYFGEKDGNRSVPGPFCDISRYKDAPVV